MTRLLAGLLLALLTAGCALDADLKSRFHLRSLICTDGLPVRLLLDARCVDGICGYTCAPDRWRADFTQ
jgi:hypothetical protein